MGASGTPRVGLVTGPSAPTLTADGRALADSLEERGLTAVAASWQDETIEWDRFDVVVLRSCWDYHEAIDAFRSFLDLIETAVPTVINPPRAIRWNLHKGYLRTLASRDAPVVPSVVIDSGAATSLEAVCWVEGWDEVVIKPAIGTSSTGVWRASTPIEPEEGDHFDAARCDSDVIVQPFQPAIRDGERSLVFIGGTFSHAFGSVPPAGEFRAHPSHGAELIDHQPAAETVASATTVVQAAADHLGLAPTDLAYARVDGIITTDGFRLLELELIEPYLHLGDEAARIERFASTIAAAIESPPQNPCNA